MVYFAYGSNLWPARLEQRVGQVQVLGAAWLDGFDLRFHKSGRDESGKCDAYRTGGGQDREWGVLYGLTPTQAGRQDAFQGPGYRRVELRVGRVSGGLAAAYTYLADPGWLRAGLIPFDWYKAYVVRGARAHGLPRAYRERLARVPESCDPDSRRSRVNRAQLVASFAEEGSDGPASPPGVAACAAPADDSNFN